MAMLSALDEQTIRALGTDDQGRLHGAPALALLLGEMVSLTGQNTWQRADTAVEDASAIVKDAALRHLLALHAFTLETPEPSIALRNVREGDYVRLHGTACYVEQVVNADKPTLTLHVRAHSAGGPGPTTFAYDRDVQIPLVARERQPA
jgi:hypothetical protein